ncbi:hypothetical protein CRD_01951 [Raphidiopsis brookii D9]|nr:hypothetical protein CRD_01951 [Raphidiopsis brookii D9]
MVVGVIYITQYFMIIWLQKVLFKEILRTILVAIFLETTIKNLFKKRING